MSWIKHQTEQFPDMPLRADDGTGEQEDESSLLLPEKRVAKDLQGLSEELLLPLEWIEEVDWLINDRKAIIFTGPPGSGKTHLARKLADFYTPYRYEFLQLHPSYAYEDLVEGYRPTANKNGELRYEVVPGPLREIAEKAHSDRDHRYVIVLDEINRANLSKVLGELFFGLEYRDKSIRSQYSAELIIPSNLIFIGTMNTADRSIASFDAALRRRFHFIECDPTNYPFNNLLRNYLEKQGRSDMRWLAELLKVANERVPDPDYSVGPSHFMKADITEEDARRIWKHSVWPYLSARFNCDMIPDLQWVNVRIDAGDSVSSKSSLATPRSEQDGSAVPQADAGAQHDEVVETSANDVDQ